jgi:hypothetical protein
MSLSLRGEWVGFVLVLLGILRAGVLVAHDPVMGYANQYDMIRTSACIGLFPAGADPSARSPDAPIAEYKTGGPRSGQCYLSTEVGIAAAVIGVARMATGERGIIRLNWIGYAKLGLLAITAFAIAFALHPHPGAALLHGVIFLGVVADPVSTLWFNSLYTEFAAIWGLYAVIGAACALALSARAAAVMWSLVVTGIVGLAFSREQYALLVPALVAAAWPWLWRRSSEMTVAAFILALAACLASFNIAPRPGMVTHVNRANAYLGVVLPASSHPQRALQLLALPARCEAMVGATWYLQRGENVQQACPEVFLLPSYAFLRFLPEEPEALARAVARVVPALQGMSPAYLGTLEGARNARASDLPWWAFSPLDAISNRMPLAVFVPLLLVSMLAAPLALLAALAWARPSDDQPHAGLLLAMLLGGTVIYCLLTSVFGDGLSEAARHFLAGALAMSAAVIAALAAIPALAARWWDAPKRHAFEIAAGFAAIPLAMLACVTAWRWAQEQPLALGVLDAPLDRQGTLPALKIRGWALDPFGVEGVQVEIGKIRREARVGEASPELQPLFPGYPDGARGRFALDLGEDDLAKAGAPEDLGLRITARSRAGAATEIDRRRLEFPK